MCFDSFPEAGFRPNAYLTSSDLVHFLLRKIGLKGRVGISFTVIKLKFKSLNCVFKFQEVGDKI